MELAEGDRLVSIATLSDPAGAAGEDAGDDADGNGTDEENGPPEDNPTEDT
jgi:hypothetical protein